MSESVNAPDPAGAAQPPIDGHPAFTCHRRKTIASLNLTMEEYEHRATGAMHYHLDSDNPENVFLVAFRTVPMDSTGVAHILEHTALCGSEKYPVRDPFFMMIRRSLNTFMNAFMNVLSERRIIMKKGSRTGYFSLPQSAVCSRICATPVESIGTVRNATRNTFSGLSLSR